MLASRDIGRDGYSREFCEGLMSFSSTDKLDEITKSLFACPRYARSLQLDPNGTRTIVETLASRSRKGGGKFDKTVLHLIAEIPAADNSARFGRFVINKGRSTQ